MNQYTKTRALNDLDGAAKNTAVKIGFFIFLLGFLPVFTAMGQKSDKVQQTIDAIKVANYCEDQDYHTDGKRIVWVKSWKKWTPEDFAIMKKEDPGLLKFFGQAIQRNRLDVLEQLLPDYYRARGGVKAYAEDIMRNQLPVPKKISKQINR